jgi:hypothetical protein
MNKRGDIAFMLIVVGAFILAGAAFFSFISFKSEFKNNSNEISLLLSNIKSAEMYAIKSAEFMVKESLDSGEELGKIGDKFGLGNDNLKGAGVTIGNFYEQIKNGNVLGVKSGGGYVLDLKDVFIFVKSESNSIRKVFDLKIEFDGNGNTVKVDVVGISAERGADYCDSTNLGERKACYACLDNKWTKKEKNLLNKKCYLKNDALPEPFGNSCVFLETLCNSGGSGVKIKDVLVMEYEDNLYFDVCDAEEKECLFTSSNPSCVYYGGKCIGKNDLCDLTKNIIVNENMDKNVCGGNGEICCMKMPAGFELSINPGVDELNRLYAKAEQKFFEDFGNVYISILEASLREISEDDNDKASVDFAFKLMNNQVLINFLGRKINEVGGEIKTDVSDKKRELLDNIASKDNEQLADTLASGTAAGSSLEVLMPTNALLESDYTSMEKEDALVYLRGVIAAGKISAELFSGNDEQERRINELYTKLLKEIVDEELLKEAGL